jgi:hypothetical protein
MSDKSLRRLPLAAAALLVCVSAQADYTSPDGKFRMSGFGTLGVSKTNNEEAQFNYPGQGGGSDKDYGLHPDTKVAVQGTYAITDTVSATAQVMTKYRAESAYVPEFEWAFLKWQATPGLTVRGGRMGAPFFMISDFRDVGYANTTVRPNLDVYGQVPVSSFEGVDVTYQFNAGPATVNATVYGGSSSAEFSSARRKSGEPTQPGVVTPLDPSEFKLKNLVGLNLTSEFDNGLTLRFGHSQGKISLSSQSVDLLLAATASGPPSALRPFIDSTVVIEKEDVSFTGVGASYDSGTFVLSAEYTKRRSDSFIADTTGWYVNAGYRMGAFTPYVGLSRLKVDDANKSNPLSAALGAVSGTGAVARGIQGLLNVQKLTQRTVTAGVRWDFMSSAALKVQFDQIRKPADSYGLFYTVDPGTADARSFLNEKRKVNVVSVAIDVVF